MGCEFICDGCGKREPAEEGAGGNWLKPYSWFQRSDEDGIQVACCRKCIDKIAKKTGKTNVVMTL